MSEALTILLRVAAVTTVALVPLINPAGTAPIFLSLTHGQSDHARAMMAARIARNACVLLAAASLGGSSILLFFGLSLAEIRIAGGLLVIATAWHLVRTDQRPDATLSALSRREANDRDLTHTAFYPLTFPVTIGPGSLAVAVTLGAGAGDAARMVTLLGVIAGSVFVALTIYLCYRFAARAARTLGDAGTLVLIRLSAFILLALGVKILGDGLAERFTAG